MTNNTAAAVSTARSAYEAQVAQIARLRAMDAYPEALRVARAEAFRLSDALDEAAVAAEEAAQVAEQTSRVVELADVDRAYRNLEGQADLIDRLRIQLAQAEGVYREMEHEAITAQAICEGLPLPEPGESADDWGKRVHTSDD